MINIKYVEAESINLKVWRYMDSSFWKGREEKDTGRVNDEHGTKRKSDIKGVLSPCFWILEFWLRFDLYIEINSSMHGEAVSSKLENTASYF